MFFLFFSLIKRFATKGNEYLQIARERKVPKQWVTRSEKLERFHLLHLEEHDFSKGEITNFSFDYTFLGYAS